MWVSTKAQYGMRALVEVAVGGERPTSLKTVARRQQLSQQYLEQIFAALRRGGIVESVRGAHGGYRVARPLDEVDALEVVELLEGSVAPVRCIDDEDACARTGRCSTESLWRDVDVAVRDVLRRTTLADLVRQRRFLQIEPLPATFAQGS
jgi:Rrf2 family transcriptional regulator, cysteine metabolism repressor